MTTIVIIGGLPCTGKSSVAAMLREQLHWPLLAKDAIKETLFDALGCRDREWSRDLSRASYAVLFAQLEQLLKSKINCIIEGNFRPEHSIPFRRLIAPADRCVQILCKAQGDVLLQRFTERARSGARHSGHVDLESLAELTPELLRGRAAPLQLPGLLLEFDSTAPASAARAALLNEIAALARPEACSG